MLKIKSCIICKKDFLLKPSHYEKRFCCSRICMAERYKIILRGKANPNFKDSKKICKVCGKVYINYNKKNIFCSVLCYSSTKKGKMMNEETRQKIIETWRKKILLNPPKSKKSPRVKKIYFCKTCQIPVKERKLYCEKCSPYNGKTLIQIECFTCGKIIKRYEKQLAKYNFCSRVCYTRKGTLNPRWNGGITPENRKIRASEEYKKWREAVFKRDSFTCIFCKKIGGELHADHIKPFSIFPDLRLVLSNGRTLCKECHKNTDSFLSKGKKIKAEFQSGGKYHIVRSLDDVIALGL